MILRVQKPLSENSKGLMPINDKTNLVNLVIKSSS